MCNCSNLQPIMDNKRLNTPICRCTVTVATTIKRFQQNSYGDSKCQLLCLVFKITECID